MDEQATEVTPEPITPQNVVSRPEEPAAPDSSILSGRMKHIFKDEEPEHQQFDTSSLQEQLRLLQEMQQQKQQPQSKKPDDEMATQLRELRESQQQLKAELQQRIEQQEMAEVGKEVSQWVSQNKDHFPLINEIGQRDLVFQKIVSTRNQTGRVIDAAQAGREIEQELAAIVARCAPRLGFVKRDEQTARGEEEVSTTSTGLNFTTPPNWDEMSDDEQMAYLVRQAEKG